VLAYIAFETVLTLALREAPASSGIPRRARSQCPRSLVPGGVA
jgi:hypothetical protein